MTFDELKAMHAAMTPGEWHWMDHIAPNISIYIHDGRVIRLTEPFYRDGSGVAVANANGIVALHNAFPALAERYEAMREALEEAEWQGFSLADIPTCPVCDGNGLHIHTCSLGNALALVAKPLTEPGT